MKHSKRMLKLAAFFLLMVLASIGMGLAGPVPIIQSKKREDNQEVRTEQVETKEDKFTLAYLEEIKS